MFLLLVPFALVLIALSILGFAGAGPLTDDRRAARGGGLGSIGPAIGLMAGLGLLALAVISTVLFMGVSGTDTGGESREPSAASAPAITTPTTAAVTPTTSPPVAAAVGSPGVSTRGRSVNMVVGDPETFPTSYAVVDRLARETVLWMQVYGFEPFARGMAEQCAPTVGVRCYNQIPVQFDEDGTARFQYRVTVRFAGGAAVPGRCRIGTAPCTIVVRALEDDHRSRIQAIFGEAAPPPGRITVTPADGLSLDGEPVAVTVRDYPPGAEVFAMLCAAPAAAGPRCGAPGPQAPLRVGADGSGSTTLNIAPGPVGAARVDCTRGSDCGISVASRDVFARAPVVPISFAGRGGAAYDPTRLLLGLAVALLLVAIATWLIVRTDWSAVGEAAAPEIDDAEYADLDAIIAALPPEEDDELVSTR